MSWMEKLGVKNIPQGTAIWHCVPQNLFSCDRHRGNVSHFHSPPCPCSCDDGEAGLSVCYRRAAVGPVEAGSAWWRVLSARYMSDLDGNKSEGSMGAQEAKLVAGEVLSFLNAVEVLQRHTNLPTLLLSNTEKYPCAWKIFLHQRSWHSNVEVQLTPQ